ncbi:MAG TPA: PhoH family protein [Candidatus Eremiobacteraceae bacterium]|nr:PhoH family protein [Candidatus Eremiobacteraceae bacterium]
MSLRGLDDRVRLFGELDGNLTHLERGAGVVLHVDGDEVVVAGETGRVAIASAALETLIKAARSGSDVSALDVELALRAARDGLESESAEGTLATTRRGRPVRPRTPGQRALVEAAAERTLVFAIGPAGTGKTFLAVVLALAALRAGRVQRIVLSRPAVEAGEKLGFLPGDLQEKVDPYLRPLFDALGEILEPQAITRAVERGQIEVAPLAYMRGRTLADAFIVLDEAQNTTNEQMKMFLTRIGAGSRMLVCGDVTQIDLPSAVESGLVAAQRLFAGVPETSIVELTEVDVVRHPLIRRIIEAYARGKL